MEENYWPSSLNCPFPNPIFPYPLALKVGFEANGQRKEEEGREKDSRCQRYTVPPIGNLWLVPELKGGTLSLAQEQFNFLCLVLHPNGLRDTKLNESSPTFKSQSLTNLQLNVG